MSSPVRSSHRDFGSSLRRLLALMIVLSMAVAACGSGDSASEGAAGDDSSSSAPQEAGDEDNDDEDHGDEEDGDHDHDHEDEEYDDHDDEDHASGLAAHEHGTAELTVAWTDADLVVELVSPTFNVFGFEYEPETDEDVELSEERTEALTAQGLLVFNDEAACARSGAPSNEVEREGSHSELTVSWSFTCDNPSEIRELDLASLFAEFPSFEDIDAQWVSPTEQSSAELSSTSPVLRLES